MAILQGWLPPTREHWELLVFAFGLFPLISPVLWSFNAILMGKHSTSSRWNIPGKIGWATMEAPGFVSLLLTMTAVQRAEGIESLPKANWLMAGLYTTHYIYRSLLSPLLLAPSMSPMHPTVWAAALIFQITNGVCIGGWLGGYGPVATSYWTSRMPYVQAGTALFLSGFVGNIYHDDALRELRREAAREQLEQKEKQEEKQKEKEVGGDGKGKEGKGKEGETDTNTQKIYKIPSAGLFRWIFYPHYLCEWIEWAGFWIIGGSGCAPARNFWLCEVAVMTPQAVQGWKWYVEKFGAEKVAGRKAVLPGLL